MLQPDTIKSMLKDRNLNVVASKTGVSYNALTYWIRNNNTQSYEFILALSDYLENNAQEVLGQKDPVTEKK